MAPPADPFGVRAVLRTLLGVGTQLLNAVVPDAGADVGVLHYTRPSDGVSHPHVVQFPPPRRLSDGRGAQNVDHLAEKR